MRQCKADKRWKFGRMHWGLYGLLLGLSFEKSCTEVVFAANMPPAAFSGTLTLQEGKLTARIAAIPLRQVMTEVARLSGAQVLWLGPQDDQPVSVSFSSLSVAEALERLLPQKNFLLVYASKENDAQLTQIWISSLGTGGTQLQIARRPPRVEQAKTTDPPQVTNDDPLAEADPELTAVLDANLETALQGADTNNRIEAIEALSGMAEHDPRIRPLLVQLSAGEQDAQVRGAAEEALSGLE